MPLKYRQVLAGKFSPPAIYYLLSHDLRETDMAMGVACVAMVDAVASGVAYTRDPLRPDETDVLVHSIFGLGQHLVDGTLTPDQFRLARGSGSVVASTVVRKPVRLVLRPDGTVASEEVPEAEQESPSLGNEVLATLADFAGRIEELVTSGDLDGIRDVNDGSAGGKEPGCGPRGSSTSREGPAGVAGSTSCAASSSRRAKAE